MSFPKFDRPVQSCYLTLIACLATDRTLNTLTLAQQELFDHCDRSR